MLNHQRTTVHRNFPFPVNKRYVKTRVCKCLFIVARSREEIDFLFLAVVQLAVVGSESV